MKVLWTNAALGQLADIYTYIAHDSENYARRVIDRITARSKQIASFPELSAVVEEYGDASIREVLEGPYRVLYQVRSDEVVVLAVIHGARPLPAELVEPGEP